MFTSNDINEILAGCNKKQAKALIAEASIKPTCPNCGGDCKKENMGSHGESRTMVYKCQGFCKTWVYQPEWVECENEVCPTKDAADMANVSEKSKGVSQIAMPLI